MCEWGAPAPKGITKATDQGLTHGGGLGLLGRGLGAGRFESPLSWNSKVDLGFLGPCGRVNLFPSSARRARRLELAEKGHVWRRPTVLRHLVCPLPQPSLFSLFVTGIAHEGEVFGKLRTVPDLRSGPSASSNPSYPSLTGVGGDYKFPWVPTLVPACCMVSSTGSACLPAELRQAQAPKGKDGTSTDNCYLKSWQFYFGGAGRKATQSMHPQSY